MTIAINSVGNKLVASDTLGGTGTPPTAGQEEQYIKLDLGGNGQSAPVVGSVPVRGNRSTLTDRSGTIATGGSAQTLAAVNNSRSYLLIQNNSTGDLWVNFTTAAVASQPSIKITVGGSFVMEGTFVSTELVSIFGAASGQAFTAKEG